MLRGVDEKLRSIEGNAMLVPVTLIEVSMKAAATTASASQARRGTDSSTGRGRLRVCDDDLTNDMAAHRTAWNAPTRLSTGATCERLPAMWLRLRQIAIVAEDLRQAALDIGTVLGLEACFTDPSVKVFGLKNTLWPVGSQFIEVVTPIEENTAGGRYRTRRGGDTGYMVITQCDDVERRKARAAELGIRIAFDMDYPKEGHRGIQLHPADTGGSFFEMDQMTMEGGDAVGGPWTPAGKAMNWQPYSRTDVVSGISGVELQSADPEKLARRWADMAEVDLETDAAGNPSFRFDNAVVRVVEATDGRGEGLGGIDVTTVDRDAVLAGARQRGCYVSDDQVALVGLRVYLR